MLKIARISYYYSMNTCLFRSGCVLVRINLVAYKYVTIYMCIVKDTYYIRFHIYAQQLKYMIVRVYSRVESI